MNAQDWGRPGNIHNLKLQWHLPTEQEMTAAQALLDRFLGDELKELRAFADSQLVLSKEQLRTRLVVVNSIIMGCGSVLPFWGERQDETEQSKEEEEDFERVSHVETLVDAVSVLLNTSTASSSGILRLTSGGSRSGGGNNARRAVAEALFAVARRLLREGDDTKSQHSLVTALQTTLLFGGASREDHEARLKSYHIVRKALENRLVGGRRQIRALLVDRALLQHEQRLLERCRVPFTKLHARYVCYSCL